MPNLASSTDYTAPPTSLSSSLLPRRCSYPPSFHIPSSAAAATLSPAVLSSATAVAPSSAVLSSATVFAVAPSSATAISPSAIPPASAVVPQLVAPQSTAAARTVTSNSSTQGRPITQREQQGIRLTPLEAGQANLSSCQVVPCQNRRPLHCGEDRPQDSGGKTSSRSRSRRGRTPLYGNRQRRPARPTKAALIPSQSPAHFYRE
jgi:hypothetical protein